MGQSPALSDLTGAMTGEHLAACREGHRCLCLAAVWSVAAASSRCNTAVSLSLQLASLDERRVSSCSRGFISSNNIRTLLAAQRCTGCGHCQ